MPCVTCFVNIDMTEMLIFKYFAQCIGLMLGYLAIIKIVIIRIEMIFYCSSPAGVSVDSVTDGLTFVAFSERSLGVTTVVFFMDGVI